MKQKRSSCHKKGRWPGLAVILLIAVSFIAQTALSEAKNLRLVAFGDSLTAGYGLAPNDSFPMQLGAALHKLGYKISIKNAGVSGDTTSAGLERLDWAVSDHTDGVLLALGANDALRGLPPEQAHKNLDKILAQLTHKKIPVLLVGMEAPRNLGKEYGRKFHNIYKDLAQNYPVSFYPFFLKGVILDPKLNQSDGIHPNAQGVQIVVANMLPSVRKFIEKIRDKKTEPGE